MKIKIARIIIIPVLIISSATTVGLMAWVLSRYHSQLKNSYISRFEVLQKGFVQSIRQDVLIGQYGEVFRTCNSLMNQPAVVGILIMDSSGAEICKLGNVIKTSSIYSNSSKIWFDPQNRNLLASVDTYFDLSPLEAEKNRLLLFGSALIFLGLVSCLLIFIIVRSLVVRPIELIERTVATKNLVDLIINLQELHIPVLEIGKLRDELVSYAQDALKADGERLHLERERTVVGMSRQLAHDIRSPLSAMNVVTESLMKKSVPEANLLSAAVKRIDEIANVLLIAANERSGGVISHLELGAVVRVINEITEEFKIRYGGLIAINIVYPNKADYPLALGNISKLGRMLSNFVQNSIDARWESEKLKVDIVVEGDPYLSISISDNGKGVPEKLMSNLGKSEFSMGKAGGNGIGLQDAHRIMESWKGKLLFSKSMYGGLQVSMIWVEPIK